MVVTVYFVKKHQQKKTIFTFIYCYVVNLSFHLPKTCYALKKTVCLPSAASLFKRPDILDLFGVHFQTQRRARRQSAQFFFCFFHVKVSASFGKISYLAHV